MRFWTALCRLAVSILRIRIAISNFITLVFVSEWRNSASGCIFLLRNRDRSRHLWPFRGGKTTVSRLATRFWDIDRGMITVGGMDVSKIDPEKLMSLYSIVFQDVTLFNNSILENIRIGSKMLRMRRSLRQRSSPM